MKHQEEDNNTLHSPKEIGEHLRVTSVPTYLLAAAVILMLGAFIVWGFLGKVSDKAYYSGIEGSWGSVLLIILVLLQFS